MNCTAVYQDVLEPNIEERNHLKAVLALILVTSSICLLTALHNIYKYLLRDGRWRIFLLSMFYISVVLQLVFQISNASVMI